MAYKYEIEQKAKSVKIRVLLVVYIMFVVSSILIGIAVRLQQIQSIKVNPPQAADLGVETGVTGDPNYSVKQLAAVTFCNATVNGSTVQFPLNVSYTLRRVRRDVGQLGTTIDSACSNASSNPTCDWKNYAEGSKCLNGNSVAQCSTSTNDCSAPVPGALYGETTTSGLGLKYEWPTASTNVGVLTYDDTEVDIFLNTNQGDLNGANPTVVYNGVTYNINKSSLTTVETNSLFPIYRWVCNNDLCSENSATCANGSVTYSNATCQFNSSTNTFSNCPANKYVTYPALAGIADRSFFYTRSSDAGQVAGDPTWIRMSFAHDTFADSTYPNTSVTAQELITMRGNIAKFRYTCSTDTVTVTPSVLLDARKTGPTCVERMAPRNDATFTVTVRNTGDSATVIESVVDSLPQGFTYRAGSTTVNGVNVSDTYVTTVNSGTSQTITFAPPSTQPLWSIDVGATLTITFHAIASTTAVTGTNTNRAVVHIVGSDAVDNISYQFLVEQTCEPVVGLLDHPILVFTISGVLLIFGFYLLYGPGGDKVLLYISGIPTNIGKKFKPKKIDTKKQFEKGLVDRIKRDN